MLLAPSFAVFVIAMMGETNRASFDVPEAESEAVGGFHTANSSLKAIADTVTIPWLPNLWDGFDSVGWFRFLAFKADQPL